MQPLRQPGQFLPSHARAGWLETRCSPAFAADTNAVRAYLMLCDVPTPRRPRLNGGALLGLLLLLAPAAFAAEPMIITSVSRQFVVRGTPQRSALAAGAKDDYAYLDPATLAVTCEKVKRALEQELGWGERWRGNIYLNIHPVRRDRETPDLQAFQTDRGWAYRIDLPDEISRRHLLEALVETLVLEFADRAATNQSVVLPPWLVRGLTAHLSEGRLAGIALQARSLQQISDEPLLRAPRNLKHIDVDQALRQRVQAGGILNIDQLNWPEFEGDHAMSAEDYHYSAHLLVRELLRLRGGPDALCATLALLPEHLNWQTAFLRGFEPHFQRMLDVEKWWSITLSQWRAHDVSVFWSSPEARRKLEEILYTPMEVRLANEVQPHLTPVSLQTVLNDWSFEQQSGLLQTKVDQLRIAQQHSTSNLTALVLGYHRTLAKYLETRRNPGRLFTERRARSAVAQAVEELNALDEQRARLNGEVRPTNTRTDKTARTETVHRARDGASPWSEPRPGLAPLPMFGP